MKNRRHVFLQCAVLCIVMVGAVAPFPLGAQTAQQVEQQLRAAGYSARGGRPQGGLPSWTVTTPEGAEIQLSMSGDLTAPRREALAAFRRHVLALGELTPASTRVIFERDRGTLILIPARFVIAGRDVARYMPSGMQFAWDDALTFDFRLVVDNLAVRINGSFLSEDQFRSRIIQAVEDPVTFIEAGDPQIISRRVDVLQEAVDGVAAALTREAATREEELAAARRDGEASLMELERRGSAALETLSRQAMEEFAAVREEIAALQEEIAEVRREQARQATDAREALQEARRELQETMQAFQRGAVVLATRSLFGSLREIDDTTIDAAVTLRMEEPDIEADELRERVNEMLPEGAAALHARHVQAILALFFNDYR